jgi:hypothetical protein
MRFNLFRYYDGMAAGLKSMYFHPSPYLNYILTSLKSRHLALFRSCRGILDDHPFLCTLVELAPSPRRWVVISVSPTTLPGVPLLSPS